MIFAGKAGKPNFKAQWPPCEEEEEEEEVEEALLGVNRLFFLASADSLFGRTPYHLFTSISEKETIFREGRSPPQPPPAATTAARMAAATTNTITTDGDRLFTTVRSPPQTLLPR